MIKTYYALSAEALERSYAFREMEARVRRDLSVELIEKIKAETVTNIEGKPLYENENGIANINILGTLEPHRTISDLLQGDVTTYSDIEEATLAAEDDFSVKEIHYHINSPGGNWDGVDFCAEIIKAATKPTTAIVYTGAQSGGYYLASQADKILARTKGSLFGSIGVAAEIFDRTEEEGKKGIKRLIFTNSQSADKRPDAKTEEGSAVIEEELNMLYKIFEDRVIEGRNRNIDNFTADNIRVLKGRSVIAERALELGLIDGIMTDESLKPKSSAQAVENKIIEGEKMENTIEKPSGAETGPGADEVRKAESDRITGILALSGGILNAEAKQAIEAGITPEKFAYNALIKQREIEAKQRGNDATVTPAPVAQTPGEQGVTKDTDKKTANYVTEADISAIAAGIGRR